MQFIVNICIITCNKSDDPVIVNDSSAHWPPLISGESVVDGVGTAILRAHISTLDIIMRHAMSYVELCTSVLFSNNVCCTEILLSFIVT